MSRPVKPNLETFPEWQSTGTEPSLLAKGFPVNIYEALSVRVMFLFLFENLLQTFEKYLYIPSRTTFFEGLPWMHPQSEKISLKVKQKIHHYLPNFKRTNQKRKANNKSHETGARFGLESLKILESNAWACYRAFQKKLETEIGTIILEAS